MAKPSVQQKIRDLAIQIIRESPTGIRSAELVRRIAQEHPETSRNAIYASIWDLDRRYPDLIHKPSRGLFVQVQREGDSLPPAPSPEPRLLKEEAFYHPFAQWLKDELDEVTVAAPIGGAGFQKKWGTPDVVGIYKPLASHRIKFDLEIVSAEVKVDPNQSIIAFGQAAAYRLFSHKSYVVMPNTISPEDVGRLEALCMLYGIGLVLFEPNLNEPNFSIRLRAQRFSPDMFYVNEFADRLYEIDPSTFDTLFG